MEGAFPDGVSKSEKDASQVTGMAVLRVGEALANLAEQLLVVNLYIFSSTSVCLAYCHQSYEVCT